jgi:hypothetical protein
VIATPKPIYSLDEIAILLLLELVECPRDELGESDKKNKRDRQICEERCVHERLLIPMAPGLRLRARFSAMTNDDALTCTVLLAATLPSSTLRTRTTVNSFWDDSV